MQNSKKNFEKFKVFEKCEEILKIPKNFENCPENPEKNLKIFKEAI